MTKILLPSLAAAALLSLAACETPVEEVDTRAPDPMASELANAAPVELPPAITATVRFRCQPGNEVIGVDFFQGEMQATLRTDPDRPGGMKLTAEEGASETYVGEGYTLKGDAQGVTLERPEGATLTCTA